MSLLLRTNKLDWATVLRGLNKISHKSMSTEVEKAERAAEQRVTEETIFDKILRNEVPTSFIYEDDKCVAFNDINPQAPKHFLVIPRKRLTMLSEATDSDAHLLGHMLVAAKKIAEAQGLENGYRVVINNGKHGCQSIYHLHIHVLGGKQLKWPPG